MRPRRHPKLRARRAHAGQRPRQSSVSDDESGRDSPTARGGAGPHLPPRADATFARPHLTAAPREQPPSPDSQTGALGGTRLKPCERGFTHVRVPPGTEVFSHPAERGMDGGRLHGPARAWRSTRTRRGFKNSRGHLNGVSEGRETSKLPDQQCGGREKALGCLGKTVVNAVFLDRVSVWDEDGRRRNGGGPQSDSGRRAVPPTHSVLF